MREPRHGTGGVEYGQGKRECHPFAVCVHTHTRVIRDRVDGRNKRGEVVVCDESLQAGGPRLTKLAAWGGGSGCEGGREEVDGGWKRG